MSYVAYTIGDRLHVSQGSSSAHTLLDAVKHVAKTGLDVEVVGATGSVVYDLEADTKVDDSDPFFPVIIHTRSKA